MSILERMPADVLKFHLLREMLGTSVVLLAQTCTAMRDAAEPFAHELQISAIISHAMKHAPPWAQDTFQGGVQQQQQQQVQQQQVQHQVPVMSMDFLVDIIQMQSLPSALEHVHEAKIRMEALDRVLGMTATATSAAKTNPMAITDVHTIPGAGAGTTRDARGNSHANANVDSSVGAPSLRISIHRPYRLTNALAQHPHARQLVSMLLQHGIVGPDDLFLVLVGVLAHDAVLFRERLCEWARLSKRYYPSDTLSAEIMAPNLERILYCAARERDAMALEALRIMDVNSNGAVVQLMMDVDPKGLMVLAYHGFSVNLEAAMYGAIGTCAGVFVRSLRRLSK